MSKTAGVKVSVLFVCLGNICRSPTAHGLFQAHVNNAGLEGNILIDSAGTGGWHTGNPPDIRVQAIALDKGYDISHLSARQVQADDFLVFDYLLAMDRQNLRDLSAIKPVNSKSVLGLFLALANEGNTDGCESLQGVEEVPDPFYGDAKHFEQAIQLIEVGAKNFLKNIRETYGL